LAALSSLVRGLNIQIKRHFIDVEGVEFLICLLKNDDFTIKLKTKAMNLLKDLLNNEQNLSTDIEVLGQELYGQTKGEIVNGKPTTHIEVGNNDEKDKQAQVNKNKKYTNIIKTKLSENGF